MIEKEGSIVIKLRAVVDAQSGMPHWWVWLVVTGPDGQRVITAQVPDELASAMQEALDGLVVEGVNVEDVALWRLREEQADVNLNEASDFRVHGTYEFKHDGRTYVMGAKGRVPVSSKKLREEQFAYWRQFFETDDQGSEGA